MSFTSGIITAESLLAADGGNDLEIQIPWYRSLPLSSLVRLDITVDGKPVDVSEVTIGINGKKYRFDELEDKWQEFWFIQDKATVHVPSVSPVQAGDSAEVTVRTDLRIPYIMIGPETPLINSVTASKTLVAREN